MRHRSLAVLAVLWALPLHSQQPVAPQLDPLEPAGTGGLPVVERALAKLSTHRRLLVIGAHPDDEDTTLLALIGSGQAGEAAYLSLSRGEGGQNLIGPELGLGLGLIRTGELMAARQIEGTRQYFTRAYDFGYTRSLEETFDRWPRPVLLADAVRAIRRFKPQVVVTIFPPEGRAGHGQHQAAGVIAEMAFHQSGYPDLFPELTAAGLPPWQAQALFRRVWRNREPASLEFALDAIDPLTGRSVAQLASASRSRHRSQDMGRLQDLGRSRGGLIWIAGEAGEESTEVFDGIDTELAAIADLLPNGSQQETIRAKLDEVSALARSARERLSPVDLPAAANALVQIIGTLEELAKSVTARWEVPDQSQLLDLLSEKRQVAARALMAAAGIAVDAMTNREAVVLGGTLPVTATLWNSGGSDVRALAVRLSTTRGWVASGGDPVAGEPASGLLQWEFEVSVAGSASPSLPYFLAAPLVGDLYDWSGVEQSEQGEPLQRAPVMAVFELEIDGVAIEVEREVVHRSRSQSEGEVRRPIRAVTPVEISVQPKMLLWPSGAGEQREIEILVRSRSEEPIRGRLELRHESGGRSRTIGNLSISEPHGQQVSHVRIDRPTADSTGRSSILAVAILEHGREVAASFPVVDYPHIRPMMGSRPANLEVQSLDLELPPAERIGYIRGAADRVPEVLRDIGLPVVLLRAETIGSQDLTVYDAIVVGSRAYETNPVLAEVNSRLIDYVRQGGLLLVQYQQYQFVQGGFAPAALNIARPHGRVTDESAPITVLAPEHVIFQSPNRITESDWRNWRQERGLYFAASWDPIFTPLLALRDPGQEEQRGSLLVAKVGKGTYIYTGLSFFRQVPAGVPGAIRLFINLLSREES